MGIWVIETIKLLFGCVVSFVLGFVVGFVYLVIVLGCAVYKVFGYVAHKVFVFVKKPIFIMKDRKKTLSSIPDLDMSLVNNRNVLSHFSYGNRLLRLYRGPNRRGYLYVPKGTESIGEHAFDDFLMDGTSKETERINENITEIVLPNTIRELDVDNIPRESCLVFANARSKSILRGSEDYLKCRNIAIRGRLFSDVLKECETLEHENRLHEVQSILYDPGFERINTAFSKIDNPLLKIELMDRFHALILSGELSIRDFRKLLEKNKDFVLKDRYYGPDVIERIYGSVEEAYIRFEDQYYESENIRMRRMYAEKKGLDIEDLIPGINKSEMSVSASKNVVRTIELLESVAKDPTLFCIDMGDWTKTQDDGVGKCDPNYEYPIMEYKIDKDEDLTIYRAMAFACNSKYINNDRKMILSSIPDLDMALVNDKDILSHLTYNNKLLRLYRGPDRQGYLYVPEGTESIGEDVFDDFLAEGSSRIHRFISGIVLPTTIKELDVDKIPGDAVLIFTDARAKSLLRGSKAYLESRSIEIKGRLFADVLKECETLEREELDDEEYGDEVPSILKRRDVERINTAFSKISDPSLKIRLMDKFHALVLSGDLSIPDFSLLLKRIDFEPKDRYYGKDVIEKIYGSAQNAYMRFENKYYESENIRRREAAAEKTRSCAPGKGPTWTSAKNVFKTIEFVESVAKDPTAFLTDKGWELEKPSNDVVSRDTIG